VDAREVLDEAGLSFEKASMVGKEVMASGARDPILNP
jgi:hypothetical protein